MGSLCKGQVEDGVSMQGTIKWRMGSLCKGHVEDGVSMQGTS